MSLRSTIRLGALGFLCLPGVSAGNLGLLDQVAALRFVHDNIAEFGGDPDNVTVIGQSAGAASIAILMTMPQGGGLFRRAIMQSTPFGRMSRTLEDAQRIGRRFAEVLGLKPDQAGELKFLPFTQSGRGARRIGAGSKRSSPMRSRHFGRLSTARSIPGEVALALKAGAGADIDTMIGTTREEMGAFYCIDRKSQTLIRAQSKACSQRCSSRTTSPTTTSSEICAPQQPMRHCSAT